MKGIILKKLTFPETERIYKEHLLRDFAPEEVRPLENLKRLWEENYYEAFALMAEEREAGYAFMAGKGEAMLLDYLAILPEMREHGLGSELLGMLKEHYREKRLILFETEVPDLAQSEAEQKQRIRRDLFYRRNGGEMTAIRSRIYRVDFRNWYFSLGEEPLEEEVLEKLRELYEVMLPGREIMGLVRFWREDF